MESVTSSVEDALNLNESFENQTLPSNGNFSLTKTTELSELAFKYGIFIITCFGTVGNILSVVVFSRKCFRTTTTSIFVRVLAVFDTLTLWSYSLWDVSMYFAPEITSNIFCKFLNWVMASAPHIASYTLLTVTIERLTAVICPLRVHLVFTRRRAIVCSSITVMVPTLYNAVYFYTITKLPGASCGVSYAMSEHFRTAWHYFDAITGIIVPAMLIFLLNITTIAAFHRSLRLRKAHVIKQFRLSAKQEMETLVNGAVRRPRVPAVKRREQGGNHLTVMLILVSLFYWVLMLPAAAFFISGIYFEALTVQSIEHRTRLYHIVYLLMLSNSSLDFVLYAVTARKFRHELWRVLSGCRQKPWISERTVTNCSYY